MMITDAWRVLVVEDEPDGQVVVSRMLRYFKVAADAVGTAEDALRALADSQYSAAIIDLALPGMDGIALVRAIRANPMTATLPCIAMTAYHNSAVRAQAIESGFDAYFSKPLDDTAFFRELSRVVKGV